MIEIGPHLEDLLTVTGLFVFLMVLAWLSCHD